MSNDNSTFENAVNALSEWCASQTNKNNALAEKAKVSSPRVRSFECVSYIDAESLGRFLKQSAWVSHYAYCFHDKDLWTDADQEANAQHVSGTLKTPHTHVLIYTYDAKTCSAVKKLFDRFALSVCGDSKPQNTRVNVCNSMPSMWRYLVHADDPEKIQYSLDSRHCDDKRYWSRLDATDGLSACCSNTGLAMVQDLIDGVSYRTMCERYGKEYIYHAKYLEDVVAKISWQETSQSHLFDENMFKLVLSAEYAEYDIKKFMSMLAYVKNCFSVDFNNGKAVDIYLKG